MVVILTIALLIDQTLPIYFGLRSGKVRERGEGRLPITLAERNHPYHHGTRPAVTHPYEVLADTSFFVSVRPETR